MWNDLSVLVRLERRRLIRSAVFWLRLIGFEAGSGRFYRVYVAAFWGFWAFAMWSFVVDQVQIASESVTVAQATNGLDATPALIFLLQMAYLVTALREPPLKLTAPDLAYVAPSPAARAAISLIRFVHGALLPVAALLLLGTLGGLFFGWALRRPDVGLISLQAGLFSGLLAVLGMAWGWIFGLIKQNRRREQARRAFWLIPPLLFTGALILPDVLLWPGQVWVAFIKHAPSTVDGLLLVLLCTLTGTAFLAVGGQMHMTRVMAESQLYARINKLGLFGHFVAADLIARMRVQSRLARRKRLYGHLSSHAEGYRALLSQRYLVQFRHAPGMPLRLFLTGLWLPSIAIALVSAAGPEAPQTWILFMLVLVQFRPHDLARPFRELVSRPFMRQFAPENPLWLYLNTAALPLILMSLGALLAVMVQPWVDARPAAPLAVTGLLLLGLAQALEMVYITLIRFPQIPYEYSIILSGAVSISAGIATASLWAALAAAVACAAGMMVLLYTARLR